MNDRSESLSDLKLARQILNFFFATATQETRFPEEAPRYLQLSNESLSSHVPGVAALASERPAATDEAQHRQFSSWDKCIAWCMRLTRSEAVFVADSQGFVIASMGRISENGFEGAAAELICSIEQLERIAPDAGALLWVDLDFHKSRVVGFITPPVDAGYFVVGLIAPNPSSFFAHKQIIARNIQESLSSLD